MIPFLVTMKKIAIHHQPDQLGNPHENQRHESP
jgi:hypothetical protein